MAWILKQNLYRFLANNRGTALEKAFQLILNCFFFLFSQIRNKIKPKQKKHNIKQQTTTKTQTVIVLECHDLRFYVYYMEKDKYDPNGKPPFGEMPCSQLRKHDTVEVPENAVLIFKNNDSWTPALLYHA